MILDRMFLLSEALMVFRALCLGLIRQHMVTPPIWIISMHNEPTYFCRVCGLDQLEPQYGESGNMPTFNICSCCGVEFGYQDTIISAVKAFRERWVREGMRWSIPEEMPENWSWEEQKNQIPEMFK